MRRDCETGNVVKCQGSIGPTGADGEDGEDGKDGEVGATGLTGPIGLKGDTGLTGADGETGATGLAGATGADGAKGDTGDTGPQGPRGNTGTSGPLANLTCATGQVAVWDGSTWVYADVGTGGGFSGVSEICLGGSGINFDVVIDNIPNSADWLEICGGTVSNIITESSGKDSTVSSIISKLQLTSGTRTEDQGGIDFVRSSNFEFTGVGPLFDSGSGNKETGDTGVYMVSISPIVFEIVSQPPREASQWWTHQIVSVGSVVVSLRSLNGANMPDSSEAYIWWRDFSMGNVIAKDFLVEGFSNNENSVLAYNFVNCTPVSWSGVGRENQGQGEGLFLDETLVARCEVRGISSTANDDMATWFNDSLGKG